MNLRKIAMKNEKSGLRTYIAGDWDGDQNLIRKLYDLNNSDDYQTINFLDAHKLTQSRDSSLPCSIKQSLTKRLKMSKKFVLIVGKNTSALRRGKCCYCKHYISSIKQCSKHRHINNDSFIEFECKKAIKYNLEITALYNYRKVYINKCPKALRYLGHHYAAYNTVNGKRCLDYEAIKQALM